MVKNVNKSKRFFYRIIVAIVIFGFIGYVAIRQVGEQSPKTSEFSLTISHIDEKTDSTAIGGEYPQFKGLTEYNSAIRQIIDERTADFKKNTEENYEARKALAKEQNSLPSFAAPAYTLNFTWSPQQINNTYISFLIRINAFEGGANELQDIVTFNYDVQNRRPLSLESLFPDDPSYLDTISTYVKGDLIGQFTSEIGEGYVPTDFINEGAAPTLDNFSRFTFDDSVVIFYFPKYQVAPGSYGEQRVIMPRTME